MLEPAFMTPGQAVPFHPQPSGRNPAVKPEEPRRLNKPRLPWVSCLRVRFPEGNAFPARRIRPGPILSYPCLFLKFQ